MGLATAATLLALTLPASTQASAAKPGGESCTHAPKGGKGPFKDAELDASLACFDALAKAIDSYQPGLRGLRAGCPPADGREGIAASLQKVAASGQAQVAATRKAKVAYWKAEAEWYHEHSRKKGTARQIDVVVDALGKAAFAASGYWASLENVASAMRNVSGDDCSDVVAAIDATEKARSKADTALNHAHVELFVLGKY